MRKTFFSDEELGRILGKERRNKQKIEQFLGIAFKIEGNTAIIQSKRKDPIQEYFALRILEALALGFNFETASQLQDANFTLKKIALKSYAKKSRLTAVKGRIIGTKGKAIKVIEELTDCSLVLRNNILGVIGKIENVETASRAIEMLIRGSPHAGVYNFLEKSKARLKELEEENIEEMIEK